MTTGEITRRGFVVTLLALGVTACLPLPTGIRVLRSGLLSCYVGISSGGPINFLDYTNIFDEIGEGIVVDRRSPAVMALRNLVPPRPVTDHVHLGSTDEELDP